MDRGCGEGEADCHASDVGHWLAMTDFKGCGALSGGGVRAPRPTRDKKCLRRGVGDAALYRGIEGSAMQAGGRVLGVKFIGTGKNKAACIAFLRRFCYNMK